MKTHKAKAFLLAEINNGGRLVVWSADVSRSFPNEYILMAVREVEFQIDLSDDEIVRKQIDGIEEAKSKLLAETQVKINRFDEQIQSLLAITHQS